jgi:uracil-DNA glycosylase
MSNNPSRADHDWMRFAAGMQNALQVTRNALFDGDDLLPMSLPELSRVSYVGWIGPRFAGTIIVGKNPGGGGDAQSKVKLHDREVANALERLRTAAPGDRAERLTQVYGAFAAQSPTIGMGTLMGRVLEALGDERDQVAFVNMCPYRTRNDADPKPATIERCARLVLAPLVASLRPDTVILLGAVARRAAPLVQARWVYSVPRGRNDRQLNPDAVPVLEAMRLDRTARAAHRKVG